MQDGVCKDNKEVREMSYFELDSRDAEKIIEKVIKFSDGREAEEIINQFLWREGGELISNEIRNILPVSGRTWAGKEPAAKSVDPFLKDTSKNLQVRIRTKGKYHYLYFPDDGSDTIHHVGNQQFMFDGASRKAEEISEKIVDKLVKRLEES